MNRIEIRQLVESARRLGLVAPSGFKQDVYGNPTLSDDNPRYQLLRSDHGGERGLPWNSFNRAPRREP
jgi:hypothetical protein